MSETKKCPILMLQKDYPILCMEENCVWYVVDEGFCSLTSIASSLRSIEERGIS